MYAWYRQLHPPTGIEHCLYCNFTSDNQKELVVSAGSQLTVYRLRRDLEVPAKDSNGKVLKDKLEQVGSWQLYGNICSMKSVRFVGSAKDSILLSFKDAKLSIIDFDDSTREIKSSSLHFFEDDLHKNGSTIITTSPIVAIDPENRCACMLLTPSSVAILPFRTRESAGVMEEGGTFGTRSPVLASYKINLKEVDDGIQVVKDLQFLHGYYEPTLLILYESHRTWSGRITLRQDTCNIIAISLNVSEKLHPVIWSLGSLPYDCKYALAVPKPIGGVLLFASSSMIYLNQSVPPYGLSMNCHTKNSTSFPLKYEEGLAITLDMSNAVFLSSDCLVMSLKNGDLYVVSLLVDGMRTVRNFRLEKAAASVLTTCGVGEPASKRKRLNTAAEWTATDMDDLEVYGRDAHGPAASGQLLSYTFEFANQREVNLELVILSGKGKNGSISVLQRTLKPQVVTTFQLPGCTDMWTVKGPHHSENKETGDKTSEYHGFLILTREDSTLILETAKEIMEVEESGFCSPIIKCSICDPYAILLTSDGQVVILTLKMDEDNDAGRLYCSNPSLLQTPQVDYVYLYRDTSGMFVTDADCENESTKKSASASSAKSEKKQEPKNGGKASDMTVDEEDELLYGMAEPGGPSDQGNSQKPCDADAEDNESDRRDATFWAIILRANRNVEARIGEELLVYEAFPYSTTSEYARHKRKSLQLRFKKVDHGKLMMRSPGSYSEQDEKSVRKEDSVSRLRAFTNIGGYSGVFVCGPYPHWLFMTIRGALRSHPMVADGRVTCFVPFHNVNCPRGFLYFNGQYDCVWPLRKIPLRSTPHFIKYCVEHKIYALIASTEEPCKRIPVLGLDGEKDHEELEETDGFIYPTIDKFYLELMSPVDWQVVPNTRFEFDEFEHVTCMCVAPLGSLAYQTTQRKYLVIGTANVMGEEMACRGRILIFEIIEVVPEPGQPLTKNKLKKIYADEQKGAVTALCGVEGNLLAAIGQKMFVWRLDDNNSLRGVAFVDTQIYTHLAFNFKDFAVIADIQRSITLLRYKDMYKTLSVVSRDVKPLEVYTAQLLVDGSSLGFLVSDREKNLILFIYNSEAIESHGGTRLLRRADIHVGSHINCMWRVGTVSTDPGSGSTNKAYSRAQVTMFATLDGAIGEVLPISEKIYRRLLMLQNSLTAGVPHVAGLNPKAFRTARHEKTSLQNPSRNVLDGDLLWKFTSLSFHERQEFARKIGTTSDQILTDFMDIQRATCVM